MHGDFSREVRRKGIQALGVAFIPFGRLGAAAFALAILVDALHLALHRRGGVPIWGRVRAMGERGCAPDPGPIMLASGAAVVLFAVRGPWAWAILCQPFLADGAAALVGKALGGPRWVGGKTVVGSAVFAVVAALVPLLLGLGVVPSLLLACVGTLVEAVAPRGTDNLLLPFGGLAIWAVL